MEMALSVARSSLRLDSIYKLQSRTNWIVLVGRGKSYKTSESQGQNVCSGTARAMATTASSETSYAVDPPTIASLPVAGEKSRFPVRRVYCVGKNYADHVVEMGGDPQRSRPVFFTKPSFDGVVCADGSVNRSSTPIRYPPSTSNLHYEVELVVAIRQVPNLTKDDDDHKRFQKIMRSIYGYTVGIDLTRRDLQAEAKSKGLPWDTGKYFDQSAPMGAIARVDHLGTALDNMSMELVVNGKTRQSVRLENMIWKVPEIIAELSKFVVLQPGDLIMTGTPSGVGPVVVGDRIVGTIDGLAANVDITLV